MLMKISTERICDELHSHEIIALQKKSSHRQKSKSVKSEKEIQLVVRYFVLKCMLDELTCDTKITIESSKKPIFVRRGKN